MSAVHLEGPVVLFSRGVVGSDANGESAAYLAGERRSNDVCVFLNVVLDNSGSMNNDCGNGKTKLQVALDCLHSVVTSPELHLHRPDSLVVRTFNRQVSLRLVAHPEAYDHRALVASLMEPPGGSSGGGSRGRSSSGSGSNCISGSGCSSASSSQGSRMRDAICEALIHMEGHKATYRQGLEVVRFLLVLTDGADEGSRTSTQALLSRLAVAGRRLTHLHLVIIAAGLNPDALHALRRLCGSQQHQVPVTLIQVARVDELNMREAFSQAMDHLRVLLYRTSGGRTFRAQYTGRDVQQVAAVDRLAAAALGGFKGTRVVTGGGELRSLAVLAGVGVGDSGSGDGVDKAAAGVSP